MALLWITRKLPITSWFPEDVFRLRPCAGHSVDHRGGELLLQEQVVQVDAHLGISRIFFNFNQELHAFLRTVSFFFYSSLKNCRVVVTWVVRQRMLLKTCLRHRYKLVFLCFSSCCTPRTLRHGLLAMPPSKFCFVTAQIRILHKTAFGPAHCRPQALVITLRAHTLHSFLVHSLPACLTHTHL